MRTRKGDNGTNEQGFDRNSLNQRIVCRVLHFSLQPRPTTLPLGLRTEPAPNRSSGAEEEPKSNFTGAQQESLTNSCFIDNILEKTAEIYDRDGRSLREGAIVQAGVAMGISVYLDEVIATCLVNIFKNEKKK